MQRLRPNHRVLANVVLVIALAAMGAKYLERYEVHGRANALKDAEAAYLWACRYELVEWNEWSADALARAEREDKPLFVDLGVFWSNEAQVLGQSCFSEPEIAQYLNSHFVCVKVDAAQRPDLAESLMWQARAASDASGLPLYLAATPEGEVYAATGPLPPDGDPGMLLFVRNAKDLWSVNRSEIERLLARGAARLEEAIAESEQRPSAPRAEAVAEVLDTILESFDPAYGGFLRPDEAGKRLDGAALGFLLRRAEGGDAEAERVLEAALQRLADSALHDPIHGGFHLRSSDRQITLPDFAKLTEANAQMLSLYARAGVLLDNPSFIAVARRTAELLQSEMWDRVEGKFITGIAGASKPEEPGRYYTWSLRDLEEVLTPAELTAARLRFGIEGKGGLDWNPALHPLRAARTYERVAEAMGTSVMEARETVADAVDKMADAPARRTMMPPKDGSAYTNVNGVAAHAFAVAGEVLADTRYIEVARRTVNQLMELPRDRFGLLPHGPGVSEGLLADQVWPARAAIVLYRVTQDENYLRFAAEQVRRIEAAFEDRRGWWGLWWRSEDKRRDERNRARLAAGQSVESPLVRNGLISLKPADDSEVISPNAAAAMLVLELHEMVGDREHLQFARRILYAFGGSLVGAEMERAGMAMAMDRYLHVAEGAKK